MLQELHASEDRMLFCGVCFPEAYLRREGWIPSVPFKDSRLHRIVCPEDVCFENGMFQNSVFFIKDFCEAHEHSDKIADHGNAILLLNDEVV